MAHSLLCWLHQSSLWPKRIMPNADSVKDHAGPHCHFKGINGSFTIVLAVSVFAMAKAHNAQG